MPEVAVKDISNKSAGKLSLPEDVFGVLEKDALLHASVVNYLANQRQGTHSTLTKGNVRGGGRKPYKQKGTGRARQGSIRAPHFRGGGTVFGPHPRDYYYSMPKKARRQALNAALSTRLQDGCIVVVEELKFEAPKTKDMARALAALEIEGGSVLIVTKDLDRNVQLSARNIPGVTVRIAADLNAYEVMAHRKLLVTRSAAETLAARTES